MRHEASLRFPIGLSYMKRIFATASFVAAIPMSSVLADVRDPAAMIEWPYVGSDPAHTKFSSAGEITAAHVDELEIVWQWEPNEMPLKEYGTRPFPTRPSPFSRQGVSLKDANDLTPEVHALAVEEMWRFRLGPLFTLPSLQGTMQRTGASGAANWGGAAFGPLTGFLYVRTWEGADTNRVCVNTGNDPEADAEYSNNCL